MIFSVSISAETTKIVDNAGLLTIDECEDLENLLKEISLEYSMDVCILTEDSYLSGKSTQEYSDDFFENNCGFGDNKDGIMLFVNMYDREWHISTCGYGITVFTDYGLEYIESEIIGYLSDGEYYDCFIEFINLCGELLLSAENGNVVDVPDNQPYDDNDVYYENGGSPIERISFKDNLIIAVVFGFIVAIVSVSAMKAQLKTVRSEAGAKAYEKKNSMNITSSRDIYLYRNIRKTPRPKDSGSNRSGAGSSVHRSSSGRSFGGRGGKF